MWQLLGVGVLVVLAPLLRIPYPILLVLGGLALAFVPGLPEFELRPEVILLGFLRERDRAARGARRGW